MNTIQCMLGRGMGFGVEAPVLIQKGTEPRHGTGSVKWGNEHRCLRVITKDRQEKVHNAARKQTGSVGGALAQGVEPTEAPAA